MTTIERRAGTRACVLGAGNACAAQAYPNRPIRVLVPFAAGGAVDTLARIVGQKLSESVGQPVHHREPAGRRRQSRLRVLAKSPPDGYTVLQTVNGIAISPSLYKVLPFDSHKDFTAVTQLVRSQLILVANPKLEANNVAELIKLAKAQARRAQLRLDRRRQSAQPDDGDAQERGRPGYPGGDLSRRRTGQRRADRGRDPLGVMRWRPRCRWFKAASSRRWRSAEPSALRPCRTADRARDHCGLNRRAGRAISCRPARPREVVARLQQETAKVLKLADVMERLRAGGNEGVGSTPEEFDRVFRADMSSSPDHCRREDPEARLMP